MTPLLPLLLCAGLAAGEAAALLPLPELLRSLDPKQEWLLLPEAEWRRLTTPDPQRVDGAWIADADVHARIVAGKAELTASFTAINRADAPRWAQLLSSSPTGIGIVTLGGMPALMHPLHPTLVLLPPRTTCAGSMRWSAPPPAIPLPCAAGVSFRLAGDGRGQATAPGLVRDGDGWRLAVPAAQVLDIGWNEADGGGGAVCGAQQTLDVQIQDGARPLRWAVTLLGRQPPRRLSVALPPGMSLVRPLAGIERLDAAGVSLPEGTQTFAIEGILAAGAPVALPRIAEAAWQAGTVRLASDRLLAGDLPDGWRALGGGDGTRTFAVPGPDAGMTVSALPAGQGLTTASRTTVAIGPQRSTLNTAVQVRAGAERLFRLDLRLPAGWKAAGMSAPGAVLPEPDALGGTAQLAIPAGLAPGAELTIAFSAEALGTPPPPAPILVDGAAREEHLLTLAAAPGLDLAIAAPGWRLDPDGTAPVRARMRSEGRPAAPTVTATARATAVDIDAVAWLLPGDGGTWCRCDLRVAVRDGELSTLLLDLPLRRDPDLRLQAEGCELAGDGPFRLSARKPWSGERHLRIEGRLKGDGALPRLGASLEGAARQPVLHRWLAMQAPAELDVQLLPGPGARPVDADEIPSWSQPIPGAGVLAAWRLGDGEAGTFRGTARSLAPLPAGFIDDLQLAAMLGPDGCRTRAAFRLAAAGMGDLELGLPEGATLEQAAIDGAPAAIRHDAAGLRLTLPGRTLVQVVLLYAQGRGGRQELPRLGGLPVTRSRLRLAVSPELVAVPLTGPDLMPLRPEGRGPQRSFLLGWRPGSSIDLGIGTAPPAPPRELPGDPRALTPPPEAERPRCEPALRLQGMLLSGERIGAPRAAAVATTPLARLRLWDALGHALAVALGVVVACGRLLRPATALALAAWPAAWALLAWQTPCGPLLGACEWLPGAVVLGWLSSRLLRRSACA